MLTHKGTKTLETERLTLRRFTLEDAEKMFTNWASDKAVTEFLTWPPHQTVELTKSLLAEWISDYEKPDVYNWVIELKGEKVPIGNISVVRHRDETLSCDLGYCMGTRWWGNGLMPEAGRAVLAYLFEEVGFNRIAATHDKNNPKSGRVMQKLGMTYEGTLRSAGHNNQGIVDEVWYSILKDEWKLP